MQKYQDVIQRTNGQAVIGASVRVQTYPAGVDAVIYSDNGTTTKTNPLTTDALGQYEFYAADGHYQLVITSSSTTSETLTDILLCDVSASTASAFIGFVGAGTGAVTRTSQAKMRDIVALKDAGALEDSATNDTAAWNRAIGWLNDGTCSAIFLGGVSVVSGALTTITADGAGIYGLQSSGATVGISQTSGSSNTLTFSNATPATNRITDLSLMNLSIWNSSTAPTAGCALTIVRGGRVNCVNVDLRNHFQGLKLSGGADQKWVNVSIGGPYTWSSLATGSRCALIEMDSSSNEVPGEIFFSNINWKGVNVGGNLYLDVALEIQSGDGIWFSNGHIGFAGTADLKINVAAAPSYIDSLEFSKVYFDGNVTGTARGVWITGSGQASNISFTSCDNKNHVGGNGWSLDATNCKRLRVEGGYTENNGLNGFAIASLIDASIIGHTIYDNNKLNTSNLAISATGVLGLRIHECLILGGTYAYVQGINVDGTSTNASVNDCEFGGCTTPIATTCATFAYKGNRLRGGMPSVTAAASLPATYWGFDVITVTGNTSITSLAGSNIDGAEVKLKFTGTPTFTRGNNIGLTSGGGNMVCTAGSVVQLVNDGSVWREVSRAVA